MHKILPILTVLTFGCSPEPQPKAEARIDEKEAPYRCQPDQPYPYASGIPYLGIHADAGNSDVIACDSAAQFQQSWHALQGFGLTQPNTFSPDGKTIYATTTNPDPEGCRMWALNAESGDTEWCKNYAPTVSQSAVEVDQTGDLFFTASASVISLNAQGQERWQTSFTENGAADAPWGVHFTPDGWVATVTTSGNVHLLDRDDGTILSSLSIADTFGFVAPATLDLGADGGVDLLDFLPESVAMDIVSVWGETTGEEASSGFAGFMGAGGFVDNTLGVDPSGRLYIVGGGPDTEHGALVQIIVDTQGEHPVLQPGWTATINAGSATTPSIDRNGRFVVIGDGSSTAAILNPDESEAHVRVADIFACDANTDADPDPSLCAFAFSEPLERAPLPGAPAITPDGTVIFYEFSLNFAAGPDARDVVALSPDGIQWQTTLPDDLDWNSVVTVTNNHVIGTASRVTLSDQSLLGLAFPIETEDYVVLLDRHDGSLVTTLPVADDSSATVTIGPDGALYAGILGILSVLSIDDRPDLGLVRYIPISE
jgi:outer membrane protein assembly factor BamB